MGCAGTGINNSSIFYPMIEGTCDENEFATKKLSEMQKDDSLSSLV
jgi:hypothetical protein